jgi:hypothetical protein
LRHNTFFNPAKPIVIIGEMGRILEAGYRPIYPGQLPGRIYVCFWFGDEYNKIIRIGPNFRKEMLYFIWDRYKK